MVWNFNEKLDNPERRKLRDELIAADDKFVLEIPKVELHAHIEGTMTADLRWKIAQRNGTEVRLGAFTPPVKSLEELREAYNTILARVGEKEKGSEGKPVLFFQAYYEGFNNLITKEDFFDLAMGYFETVAKMNVRYCEPFFDPQGHTSRGVSWDTMMGGLREAQLKAEKELGVKSQWVMCFLRDLSPESAMEHYKAAQPYKDMITGIGLDSDEYDRPPSLFEEVFSLARKDGFNITAHCDVNQKDTHDHIRQVVSTLAGTGAQRLDHGLNAAEKQELMDLILEKGTGLTVCPWAYLRHETPHFICSRIRTLYDAGIPLCICSDDPGYMENCFILHDMLLAKRICPFVDSEIAAIARYAVNICWARRDVKEQILKEIDDVYNRYYPEA